MRRVAFDTRVYFGTRGSRLPRIHASRHFVITVRILWNKTGCITHGEGNVVAQLISSGRHVIRKERLEKLVRKMIRRLAPRKHSRRRQRQRRAGSPRSASRSRCVRIFIAGTSELLSVQKTCRGSRLRLSNLFEGLAHGREANGRVVAQE